MKKDDLGYPGQEFLDSTESTLTITFAKHDMYFPSDEHPRDIYDCVLQRGADIYTFQFGNSIVECGNTPDQEIVLGCLVTCDPGTFWEFIAEYGYEAEEVTQSIYDSVREQYECITAMYSEEELTQLAEVQR